ncbi:hypothetical protein R1sor_007520 [Riccia sorocarpa]|uniref:C2H2-type domain-containing protein n=1 Tax=Riccia sorocarpa TaxID=122646 RepID=A0ABD3HU43_9MARC
MSYAAYSSGIISSCLASSVVESWSHRFPPGGRISPKNIKIARIKNRLPVSYKNRRSCWTVCACGDELSTEEEQNVRGEMSVGIFWDLDNKPPVLVPPYDAAMRLRNLGEELGEVVDMVAYANRNAFTYVPGWVREQRQDRRRLDQLEIQGLVKAEHPYYCKLCGRVWWTNVALRRHFKQVHEKERKQRLEYLKTLKGKRRARFLIKHAEEEVKYKEVARRVLVPKSGYGLASELRRAGVNVKTVESKPQAADQALKKHIAFWMNNGVDCICLVSDDTDFLAILGTARRKGVKVVVVGDAHTLQRVADASFSWEDVASGRYFVSGSRSRDDYYDSKLEEEVYPNEGNDYKDPYDDYSHEGINLFGYAESGMSSGDRNQEIPTRDDDTGHYSGNEGVDYISEYDRYEEYRVLKWAV